MALKSINRIDIPAREQPAFDASLFNRSNLDQYADHIYAGLESIQALMTSVEKPFTGILPHELAADFRHVDLDQPLSSLAFALAEVERLYLKDAVYFHHAHYVAHLNCPIVLPAILAELITSAVNTSVDTWDQSAGATFMEQKLIDWTVGRIGLGGEADGVFTSGGTQSNLMAMLLARDAACACVGSHQARLHGLPDDFRRLRIFVSEAGHFSIKKAAAILGLGYGAVIPVSCDRYFRMDTIALHEAIDSSIARNETPLAVVATAGTTDFGSIDPLIAIADICRSHSIWLHVDAAYGCGLLVSPTYRHWLAGIEHADSVTVDYHKSFFQPVSCSALLVKNRRHLSAVTYHADYLNPLSQADDGIPNLVDKSLQTTRRFDALKLWLTLRMLGADSIGEAFDRLLHLARQTYLLLLSEPSIEVAHQPRMSILTFRYCPQGDHSDAVIDAANVAIRKSLSRSGSAVIAGTKVHGRQYLKFTFLNPAATIQDVQFILKLIKQHGQAYFGQPARAPSAETLYAR